MPANDRFVVLFHFGLMVGGYSETCAREKCCLGSDSLCMII